MGRGRVARWRRRGFPSGAAALGVRVVRGVLVLVVVELVVRVKVGVLLLISERLAGEEVDRAGDDALLEVLANLVVELELLVNVVVDVLIVVLRRRRGREEREERVGGNDLLDDPRLVGVCECPGSAVICTQTRHNTLLLRCFLVSIRTVRSLPSTQSILVPTAWS